MIYFFLFNGRLYTRPMISSILEDYEEMQRNYALSGNSYYMEECRSYQQSWTERNIEYGNQMKEMILENAQQATTIMHLTEQVRILQNRLLSYGLPIELNPAQGERAALTIPSEFYDTANKKPDKYDRKSDGKFTGKKKPHAGSSIAAGDAKREAFWMKANGFSNAQIAKKLNVSEATVINYINQYENNMNIDTNVEVEKMGCVVDLGL